MKYTEVQSQQMAFIQSPSLSNNPKILNNYLIFTEIFKYMTKDVFCVTVYHRIRWQQKIGQQCSIVQKLFQLPPNLTPKTKEWCH